MTGVSIVGNHFVSAAAREAAIEAWPQEMCAVIGPDGQFVRIQNVSSDPTRDFLMPERTWIEHAPVLAVIHSHISTRVPVESPGFIPDCPSAADMSGQIATAVPWGIVVTDGEVASDVLWWGDHVLDQPLCGRMFRHGVTDCYSAVRAWYWQERRILLREYPRDCSWWASGKNLYIDNFMDAGFRRVDAATPEIGDVLLMQIGHTSVPNHAGIWLGLGKIYHHPMPAPSLGRRSAESMSRIEPLGARERYITHVLRHERSFSSEK